MRPDAKPLTWKYLALLGLWLILTGTVIAFSVSTSITSTEHRFTQYGNALYEHLSDRTRSNQTILEGFAAIFSAFGDTDPDKASRYARQVLAHHPHVFALEIVRSVPRAGLEEFVAEQRQRGHPDFEIRGFSYDTDRRFHAIGDKPAYYPVVFMEPMRAGSEEVIGLDIDTVPFLREAMFQSIEWQSAVASRPFELVEGNLAYILFRPVQSGIPGDPPHPAAAHEDYPYTVALVVDTHNFVSPETPLHSPHARVTVHHAGFAATDPDGLLFDAQAPDPGTLERLLLPVFEYRRTVGTGGDSLGLVMEKQIGWADLNLRLLFTIGFASLVSLYLLGMFIRADHARNQARLAGEERLRYLATHDGLTGLPNRNLLMDRLAQARARADRQHTRFGVLFLDLDDFKQINDAHGHQAGDLLLKLVADRLRMSVRSDDTVSRIGGDEFVVVAENLGRDEFLDSLLGKIKENLSRDFRIDNREIDLSISIGAVLYPRDGTRLETLMKVADTRMYEDKQSAKSAGIETEECRRDPRVGQKA
jgi:diguanylate cyclase